MATSQKWAGRLADAGAAKKVFAPKFSFWVLVRHHRYVLRAEDKVLFSLCYPIYCLGKLLYTLAYRWLRMRRVGGSALRPHKIKSYLKSTPYGASYEPIFMKIGTRYVDQTEVERACFTISKE